jgi:hypothetical protein
MSESSWGVDHKYKPYHSFSNNDKKIGTERRTELMNFGTGQRNYWPIIHNVIQNNAIIKLDNGFKNMYSSTTRRNN